MAKYLIQDIIPKDRKHKVAPHATGTHARTAEDHPTISHHAHPPIDEESVPRTARHTKTHRPEVVIHGSPKEVETVTENPRAILSEQMSTELHEDAHPHSVGHFIPPSETPATYSAFNSQYPSTPPFTLPKSTFSTGNSSNSTLWGTWMPWIVGFSLIAFVVALVLNFFGGATVTVLPRTEEKPMENSITAFKKPANGELGFAIMKVTLEETREVPATGEKTVTTKASGKIIIYNTQTVTQRLIKNTRFQSPAGKIYRISDSINVPKGVLKAGKMTPGTMEVIVYADEAGPDYNSPPTDFTLPGLKGSVIFDKVYARSKGPIEGGASGTLKSVSDLDLKQASDDLRIQLETKLRTKARADLVPSQIGFDGGVVIDLKPAILSKTPASSPDRAVVSEEGTIYLITFDEAELTRAIARSLIPTYGGESVTIKNIEALQLSIPAKRGEELWTEESIIFVLRGTPSIEWNINGDDVKKVLLGIPTESFNAIMAQFSTVERAKANVQPIWKRTFPTKPEDINVEIVTSMEK